MIYEKDTSCAIRVINSVLELFHLHLKANIYIYIYIPDKRLFFKQNNVATVLFTSSNL